MRCTFFILDIQKIVRIMHIVKYLEFGHQTICNKEKAARLQANIFVKIQSKRKFDFIL